MCTQHKVCLCLRKMCRRSQHRIDRVYLSLDSWPIDILELKVHCCVQKGPPLEQISSLMSTLRMRGSIPPLPHTSQLLVLMYTDFLCITITINSRSVLLLERVWCEIVENKEIV
jgi:hypothetical protein